MRHQVVDREKWIAARKELLQAEKELTRRSDELAQEYKHRMGCSFPWASSFGSDFNVSYTKEQQREGGIEYNYRREPAWQLRSDEGMASRMAGTPVGDNAAIQEPTWPRTRDPGQYQRRPDGAGVTDAAL
jgi:predicted dithiol-disulfide oxidoreductase (DUF899 family)